MSIRVDEHKFKWLQKETDKQLKITLDILRKILNDGKLMKISSLCRQRKKRLLFFSLPINSLYERLQYFLTTDSNHCEA